MKSFAEQLMEYFNNTPQEVLDKDWNDIHSQYAYGITIDELMNNSQLLGCYPQNVSPFNGNQNFNAEFDCNINFAQAA